MTTRPPLENFVEVSRSRDLVICNSSVNDDDHSGHRFARLIATSGCFDE